MENGPVMGVCGDERQNFFRAAPLGRRNGRGRERADAKSLADVFHGWTVSRVLGKGGRDDFGHLLRHAARGEGGSGRIPAPVKSAQAELQPAGRQAFLKQVHENQAEGVYVRGCGATLPGHLFRGGVKRVAVSGKGVPEVLMPPEGAAAEVPQHRFSPAE